MHILAIEVDSRVITYSAENGCRLDVIPWSRHLQHCWLLPTGAMHRDVAIHAGKLCSTCLLRRPPNVQLHTGLPKLGPKLHSALSLRLWRHSL